MSLLYILFFGKLLSSCVQYSKGNKEILIKVTSCYSAILNGKFILIRKRKIEKERFDYAPSCLVHSANPKKFVHYFLKVKSTKCIYFIPFISVASRHSTSQLTHSRHIFTR